MRDCDQAKTHGMARSDSRSICCGAAPLREAGREPPPAREGAAAARGERREASGAGCEVNERGRGIVEQGVRRGEARLLVRVRVAEHHLLEVASGAEVSAVLGVVEERIEEGARA